eukprot:384274_1
MRETTKLLTDGGKQSSNMGAIALCENDIKNVMTSNNNSNIHHLHYIYSTISYCLAFAFQEAVYPIADVLQNELHTTSSDIGLLSTSFCLTYLIFQIPTGILLQNYSNYMLLLIIVSICLAICILLFGLTTSLLFAIVLRLISGLFSAPRVLIVLAIVAHSFDNNKVQLFLGLSSTIKNLTSLCLITIQGYIYEKFHIWRYIFYTLACIQFFIVAVIGLSFYIENKQMSLSHVTKQDDEDNGYKVGQNTESKLKLVIKNHWNWCLGMYGFFLLAIYFGFFGVWFVQYLMLKFSFSRTMSSFFLGVGNVVQGMGMLIFGYLSSKYKIRKMFLYIGDFLTCTVLLLLYLDAEILNEYYVFIIIVMSRFGIGVECINYTLIREYNANQKCEEVASSFLNTLNVCAFISQYVIKSTVYNVMCNSMCCV